MPRREALVRCDSGGILSIEGRYIVAYEHNRSTVRRPLRIEAAAGIDMKKGGLAKLEIESQLRFGPCAKLAWLLTPKQMALMV